MTLVMADWLWDRIPELTQERDDTLAIAAQTSSGPLRQLIDVLALGLAGTKTDVDGFTTLVDVDTCPARFLPLLGAMMGFEFPHALPEDMQRNFIRSIVSLYRVKGTPKGMSFVGTRLIGGDFQVQITNEDWQAKSFEVQLETENADAQLSELETRFMGFIKFYTPAGLVPVFVITFVDEEIDTSLSSMVDEHVAYSQETSPLNLSDGKVLNGGFKLNYLTETELDI